MFLDSAIQALQGVRNLFISAVSNLKSASDTSYQPSTITKAKKAYSVQERHLRWTAPQQFSNKVVNNVVALVKRQKVIIDLEKSRPPFLFVRRHIASLASTAFKVMTLNGLFGYIPITQYFNETICTLTEEEHLLARVEDIKLLPPWNYNAHPSMKWALTAKILQGIASSPSPWLVPPYEGAQDLFTEARKKLFSETNEQYHQLTITTPDGVELNGIWIKGESKKVILFVPGIGGLYEEAAVKGNIAEFIAFFQKIYKGVNIVMINMRGVGVSKGSTTPDSTQIDIFSLFQFLLTQGFDPEDVLVWCHSLGNWGGLKGAALIQREFPTKKISVVSDRSFLRASDVAGTYFPYVGQVWKKYIQGNGLEIDCEEAATALQGHVVGIYSEEDTTIPYEQASFHAKMDKTKIKNYIPLRLENGYVWAHTRVFTENESSQIGKIVTTIFTQGKSYQEVDKQDRVK